MECSGQEKRYLFDATCLMLRVTIKRYAFHFCDKKRERATCAAWMMERSAEALLLQIENMHAAGMGVVLKM
eukprot:8567977-Ditylum_brightwellii.AAC.1